jgi:hypothetical protein
VAHKNETAVETVDCTSQCIDSLEVKIVGRLVKQEEMGCLEAMSNGHIGLEFSLTFQHSQAKMTRQHCPSESCFIGIVCGRLERKMKILLGGKMDIRQAIRQHTRRSTDDASTHLILARESVPAHSAADLLDLSQLAGELALHELERVELIVQLGGKMLS